MYFRCSIALPIRTAADASPTPSREPAYSSRRNLARSGPRAGDCHHLTCASSSGTPNPYTNVHRNVRAWAQSVQTSGRAPVGEIGLTMACSAHRAVRRISLIFSQEMMMAETLPTGIRHRKTGARGAAPGPGGPLHAGFGIRVYGLERRQSGSWVVKSPRGVGSRPETGWQCQRPGDTDRAPVAGSDWAAMVAGGSAAPIRLADVIDATPGLQAPGAQTG